MDENNILKLERILSNFRKDELEMKIDKKHIEKWLSQFTEDKREVILDETLHIFDKWYFNRNDISNCIDRILQYLCNKYALSEVELIKKIVFIDEQQEGTSQKRILDIVRETINERHDLNLNTTISPEFKLYVYLDDGLYSGKRVRNDIIKLIDQLSEGSNIDAFFIVAGAQGIDYAKKILRDKAINKYITINLESIYRLENYRSPFVEYEIDGSYTEHYSQEYTCLWPMPHLSNDPIIQEYEMNIKKRNNYEKMLYRDRRWYADKGIFTSEHNREVVEKEFLLKGIDIVNSCSTKMYPLGFNLWPSFGFGSFTANDFNISNTCPLVLWWGNVKKKNDSLDLWYPLLPRRVNENEMNYTDELMDYDEENQCIDDACYICPDCGRRYGFANDGGNGFCIDCAWKH